MCERNCDNIILCSFFAFISVLIISVSPAGAQVVFTTDQGQFLTDNPGLFFQDFAVANAPAGSLINCGPDPQNFATNGPYFSPGDILPGIEFDAPADDTIVIGENFGGVSGNPANVLTNDLFPDPFDILFTAPDITRAGLTIGCFRIGELCNETVTVQVFGPGDVFLDSTSIAVSNLFDTFLGITSAGPIERISLLDDNPGSPDARGLLNIRFGGEFAPIANIPALSEWGMIAAAAGLVLVGAFYALRRKRAGAG